MVNNCSNQNDFKHEGRVLFVYPPSVLYEYPPIDLMYLASVAKTLGYQSKIKCFDNSDLLEKIAEFQPSYVLANITTPTFKNDMDALAQIKSLFPHIKIIVKGEPFLTYNTNVIYENYFIDYVILGEPELTFKEILSNLEDREILGICYRENEQGVKNDLRPFNENLDELPFPDRSLVDNSEYKSILNGKSQTIIEISRGCPNNCFFCLETALGGVKIRTRSIENIILELQDCIKNYHITNFFFKSNIFNNDKMWVIDFCQAIIDAKFNITWGVNILPNKFDEDIAIIMYKSGCRIVGIGVESGAQDILNNLGKNISKEEIKNTVKLLKKYKIKINASYVLGLPWETEQTIEETINFALDLDSDYAEFNISAPFPGTRHFAYIMMNKLVEPSLSFENAYKEAVVRSHELSKEQITELKYCAEKRYRQRNSFSNKIMRLFKQ